MKSTHLFILIFFTLIAPLLSPAFSADYQINFTAGGAAATYDSIQVTNLSTGAHTTISGNQSLLLKSDESGLNVPDITENQLHISPNPNRGNSVLSFPVVHPGQVAAFIYSMDGRILTNYSFLAEAGTNKLNILLPQGAFLIKILGNGLNLNAKTICLSSGNSLAEISYQGTEVRAEVNQAPNSSVNWLYKAGDRLLFRAYSGNFSTYVADKPTSSKNIHFDFYACTDASGNHYPVVILGNKVWMADNLRTTRYRNSESIPQITLVDGWKNATSSAYCNYNNPSEIKAESGLLYNWPAVADMRLISPDGWYIPNENDWAKLDSFLTINQLLYDKTSGFSDVKTGYRNESGVFQNAGITSAYWTSTALNTGSSYNRKLNTGNPLIAREISLNTCGFSIRCVRPVYSAIPVPVNAFDLSKLPEIAIEVSREEWNKLLSYYDQNQYNEEKVISSFTYRYEGVTTTLAQTGLRLRGNTSRRRPEGVAGLMHSSTEPDWHHASFSVDMNEYVSGQKFAGLKKINLKWFKDDSMYSREVYCYDLFRKFGVWAAPESSYCRFYIHVAGDANPTYFGVYEVLESMDNDYLKKRKTQFGDDNGFLWKAFWGADLKDADASKMGIENVTLTSTYKPVYDLKNRPTDLDSAKTQLLQFIKDLNQKTGTEFETWIESKTDVSLFLKTYAVNVMCGMWDDYWVNKNNFYFYFNSSGKFFFIPYDYDNTLGTSQIITNSGTQNLLKWGNSSYPLVEKILAITRFRKIYIDYLYELCDLNKDLFYVTKSKTRILNWQSLIKDYISNDTGEDMVISDRPASWGNCSFYRLLEDKNNYFQIRGANLPGKIN